MDRKGEALRDYVTALTQLQAEDIPLDGTIRPGVRADTVLKLAGRSRKHAVLPPSKREDGTIRWYYGDCTLVMIYAHGHWRVLAIEDPEPPKPAPKKERAKRRRMLGRRRK